MKEQMEVTMERVETEVVDAEIIEVDEKLSALAQMKRSVGMTLVEIMIVITIIAMVSGAVGYFVFGALDTANEGVAENEIIRLNEMVLTYYTRNGQLPGDLAELAEGGTNLLEDVPVDPWGNEFLYEVHGPRDFTIYSAGSDGTPGTEADVHADD